MGIRAYLKAADRTQIRNTVEGKILTAPSLTYSDASGNATYCCDVDIGQEGPIDDTGKIGVLPLFNVPIAAGNRALMYAQPGNAVILRMMNRGTWEISGFSKTSPGTLTITSITLPNICADFPQIVIDDQYEMGFTQRLLTLGELGTLRPFGELALNTQAIFLNGELYGYTT